MDSNSNSYDMYSPKIEMDSESEREFGSRKDGGPKFKVHWNSENTTKLIETMEKDCKELWDSKNPLNKDRNTRQAKFEYLAEIFDTTSEEISRKIHNLRTQFNNELRKIKRRQAVRSGWEYFDSLTFLMRTPPDQPETVDTVNLEMLLQELVRERVGVIENKNTDTNTNSRKVAAWADLLTRDYAKKVRLQNIIQLAEFQADEEEEFGAAARAHVALNNTLNALNGSPTRARTKPQRVAASAPPPLPLSANPMMWPEEPVPKIRPGLNADECQIFGDFVASELRTLRSQESRKKLKRMIQKAILQIGEEEDVNVISG